MIQQLQQRVDQLWDAVRALNRMTIDGFDRHSNPDGVSFVPSRVATLTCPSVRYVVVVRDPVASDAKLLVREVRYDSDYPKPCTTADPPVCHYEWYGPSFDAFPVPGRSVMDYSDSFQAETAPLTSDTTILRCVLNHSAWIVEPKPEGGGVTRFARIVNSVPINTLTSEWLTVQEIEYHVPEGQTIGAYRDKPGGTEDVKCWPFTYARHYLPLRGANPPMVVDLVENDGIVYARQQLRTALTVPGTTYGNSNCPVTVV